MNNVYIAMASGNLHNSLGHICSYLFVPFFNLSRTTLPIRGSGFLAYHPGGITIVCTDILFLPYNVTLRLWRPVVILFAERVQLN